MALTEEAWQQILQGKLVPDRSKGPMILFPRLSAGGAWRTAFKWYQVASSALS